MFQPTVTRNPTGSWSIAGTVPIDLAYESADGAPLTSDQIAACLHCGPGFARPKVETRTWPTQEAAQEALRAALEHA